ncbi:hypothetical protein [Ferruginibacter sp.]
MFDTVLPVKLVSFQGQAGDGFNILSWVTAEELNLEKYELERSDADNGSFQWETIATVAPQYGHAYQFKIFL